MATLEKIRKKGKLIAFIIGFALLSFIVGDLFNSGSQLFNSNKTRVVSVDGKPIEIQDFEDYVNQTSDYVKIIQGQQNLDEKTNWQIRLTTWEQLLREKLLDKTFKELNFTISSDELKDMTIGNHTHPLVSQTFVNPQTGVFDKNFLIQILQNIEDGKAPQDPAQLEQYNNLRKLWLYIENYIKFDRSYQKYMNLVAKSLHVNKLEVEQDNIERSKLANLDIVYKPASDISDSTISVSEDDLKSYYEKHKEFFFNNEDNLSLDYVEFMVVPSQKDSLVVLETAKNTLKEINTSDDPQNIYTEGTKEVKYFTKNDLTLYHMDTLELAANNTLGPVNLYGSYYIFRVLKVEERPDTVSARHILISPSNEKVGTIDRANQIADSLINVLKNGGNFDQLAKQYSDDPGSKDKGGLYENFTEGQMVKEFNDYCFTKKINEVGKVQTTYGVHVIEVTDRKGLSVKPQIMSVKFDITPSEATFNDFYALSAKMRGEIYKADDLANAAKKYNVAVKIASNLTKGSYAIPGIDDAREIIRWAFNGKQNDVSQVFQLPDRYVIALITQKLDRGITPFEDVKVQIENSVKLEKKVDKIYNQYFANANITNLDALVNSTKSQKISAPNVSFNAYQIATLGYEPVILASVFNQTKNGTVGPLKGKNGVYVLQFTQITNAAKLTPEQYKEQEGRLNQALQGRTNYQALNALKISSKIEDNRINFF